MTLKSSLFRGDPRLEACLVNDSAHVTPAAQGDSKGEKENQDAASAAKKFEKEPWFAKLPPSLRSAIQSKSRGKTPRGYEERLKRYFESVE